MSLSAPSAPADTGHPTHPPGTDLLASWWCQITPGTVYWRCQIPARHLPGQVLDLQPSDLVQDGDQFHMPRQQGTAIWQYVGNKARATLMAHQQSEGVRVLLEVDDNYLIPSPTPNRDWVRTDQQAGDIDKHTFEMNRRIAGWADGVICATAPLADAYRALNPNVYVCPNSVDPADWEELDKPNDGVLRIGWAASASHAVDAPLVRRALAWASRQRDVEVWLLGTRFDGWDFKFTPLPWTDNLAAYRQSLQVLDVGVCAIVDTPWSRCKSAVKAYELAMAGAYPLVSAVAPYRPYEGPTIRCRTGKDWERAIQWCVWHRDEIKGLAAEARSYVLAKHQIADSIHLWRQACES